MSRAMIPSQQKLAEKLTILNDRGRGMLTRIYNIKKMLGNPENKPAFLSDKNLEPCLRFLSRRFPNVDIKASALVPVNNIKSEMCELVSRSFSTDPTVIDNICSCNIIHTFHSSRSHTMLSKTKIFPHPADENRLLACAGEESSNAVHVWDTSTGQLKQQLHTGGIVVDLCSINVNQQTYLAALTSKLVKIFKWS